MQALDVPDGRCQRLFQFFRMNVLIPGTEPIVNSSLTFFMEMSFLTHSAAARYEFINVYSSIT
jgi:hypothetical protein